MAGYLTTHVLDTTRGQPAEGLRIDLFRVRDGTPVRMRSIVTNSKGRTDEPVLPFHEFAFGTYELVFHAGDYHRNAGMTDGMVEFLDRIPVRFELSESAHYHVPLLLSPFGYSTYRGS